jgi:drug/metabolite transporter (DMT)-like permease
MADKSPKWIIVFGNSITGNALLFLNSVCLIGLAVYAFSQHNEKTTFQLWCGVFVLLLGVVGVTQRVVWFLRYKNKQHQ